MSFASTSEVLDAFATRIEALTPIGQSSEDDRYRCMVNVAMSVNGSRSVLITAHAATRKALSGRTCSDWETQVQINIYYKLVGTEPGEPTVYQRALTDSEQILDDMYNFVATTSGLHKIDPDLGDVNEDGQGGLISTRTFRLEYQRA
jgi:hypothetical protein